MQKFDELPLPASILTNLHDAGYTTPTPIQAQAIPFLLEGGDLLGIAQTGTGKTAAFSVPILDYLLKNPLRAPPCEPRVLILAPTRELSTQINESIRTYGKGLGIKSAVIFGGVGQASQVNNLRNGLDIVVATPGRLLDLMDQGHLRLGKIEVFVLDEADRMLDMGFIHDIRKVIAKLPPKRQTLLFSATMPPEIASLAAKLLNNPKRVEVTPPSTTVERIEQKVFLCRKADKYQLLRQVLGGETVELTLVFTRTKHGANKIVDYLTHHKIESAAIHGNKSQSAREAALANFKSGKIKVLIATDIAARGIDVQGVSHVINFDLPVEAESYVHRIGRTARAGKDGDAISFCDETERDALSRIQKLIKLKLPTEEFQGVPEESVKSSRPERPFRDPRSIGRGRNSSSRHDGPRNDGPRDDGPRDDRPRRDEGPRNDGPRNDGPRDSGPRRDGPRNDGPRDNGPRRDGPRNDGPRNDGPRRDNFRNDRGPQNRGPRRDGPPDNRARDDRGPRDDRPRDGGPRRDESSDAQPSWETQRKQIDERIDNSRQPRPRGDRNRNPRPRNDRPANPNRPEADGNRQDDSNSGEKKDGFLSKIGFKFRNKKS